MSNMEQSLVAFAEAAIRAHLARQPSAADTLAGIHRWWIDWQVQMESVELTAQALERLKAAGVVECMPVGHTLIWRAARRA